MIPAPPSHQIRSRLRLGDTSHWHHDSHLIPRRKLETQATTVTSTSTVLPRCHHPESSPSRSNESTAAALRPGPRLRLSPSPSLPASAGLRVRESAGPRPGPARRRRRGSEGRAAARSSDLPRKLETCLTPTGGRGVTVAAAAPATDTVGRRGRLAPGRPGPPADDSIMIMIIQCHGPSHRRRAVTGCQCSAAAPAPAGPPGRAACHCDESQRRCGGLGLRG